jgi:hypothetical protein
MFKGICRTIIALCAAVALLVGHGSPAQAGSKEVRIGDRPGGHLLVYYVQASHMMSSGDRYRVAGDQYSAAAMQVLFIERRHPRRVCASPMAKLHLHQAFDPVTKKTIRKRSRLFRLFTAFLGKGNLKRLGPLPEFGQGFKTVRASDYLGRCKTKAIACNVMWCGW